MSFFYIIFTSKYIRGVSAVPPDSPCILQILNKFPHFENLQHDLYMICHINNSFFFKYL
jgi:hypothetical protein